MVSEEGDHGAAVNATLAVNGAGIVAVHHVMHPAVAHVVIAGEATGIVEVMVGAVVPHATTNTP